MLLRDVAHQFHDEHGFADARAAEQADLAALAVRRDQVDNLDSRFKNFRRRALFVKCGRPAVNVPTHGRFDFALAVDRFAEDVHYPAEHVFADGNTDLRPRIENGKTARKTIRRRKRDAADDTFTDMRQNFKYCFIALHHEFFIDWRHTAFKLHIYDRAYYLINLAVIRHVRALPSVCLFAAANLPDDRSRRSVVIAFWRRRLNSRLSESSIFSAFLVAFDMASIREACSLAEE